MRLRTRILVIMVGLACFVALAAVLILSADAKAYTF